MITGSRARAAFAALLVLGCVATGHAAPAADEAHERYLADFEAACPSPPEPPELPRGGLAGRDDMVDAMREVKGFDQAVAAFADCVRARLTVLQAGPGLTDADRTQLTEIAANLADGEVAGSERLVGAFNQELQHFKARPQDKVGRRYTIAAFRKRPENLGACYPARMQSEGGQAQVAVDVTIGVDGRATAVLHSPGATPDMIKGAECVARKLEFVPASRDGIPEESVARVPINFKFRDTREWVSPTLRSNAADFVSATLACYPPESGPGGPQGRLLVRITLSIAGRVTRVVVVESTGNPILDETGRCIARKLRFSPFRIDGVQQEGSLVWAVPVRPPAAWIANPPAAQSP